MPRSPDRRRSSGLAVALAAATLAVAPGCDNRQLVASRAVGGPFEYQTPGFTDAPGRYLVEVLDGVSSLEISPDEPRRAVHSNPVEAST